MHGLQPELAPTAPPTGHRHSHAVLILTHALHQHSTRATPLTTTPHTRPQVRTIDRVCEIPHEGPFCDLMWSDPEDIDTWAVSPRGAGWLFGKKVTSEFNYINGGWQEGLASAALAAPAWELRCNVTCGAPEPHKVVLLSCSSRLVSSLTPHYPST